MRGRWLVLAVAGTPVISAAAGCAYGFITGLGVGAFLPDDYRNGGSPGADEGRPARGRR